METKKEYQWASWGDVITKKDVNKVVAELDEIKSIHGKINPTLVINKAKDKKSVLHSFFNWDDKSAADAYRRQEASMLLRHIQVKVIKDDKPYFIRAYEVLNTSSDNFMSDVKYIATENMTPENIEAIRKSFMSDLDRMIKRMTPYEDFDRAKSYLQWAIKILLEESAGTKTEIPVASKNKLVVASQGQVSSATA